MPSSDIQAGGQILSDEAIRERAYYLWEADGRPDGMGDHYWHRAHAEATADFARSQAEGVASAMGNPVDGPAVTPTKKPRTKKADKAAAPKAEKADKPSKLKAKIAEVAKVAKASRTAKKAEPKPRAAVPTVKSK